LEDREKTRLHVFALYAKIFPYLSIGMPHVYNRLNGTDGAVALHEIITKQQHWFALTVKPRHEKTVAQSLRHRGLEDFLPLYSARRRWSDRVKAVEFPLFPGYVFCRFDYERRFPVVTTPGVISIVGFANLPTPVSEDEIAAVRTILASNLPAQPWPVVRVGQSIRIERGSLAGLQGILIREKDSLRVVISLELLQRAVAVEIDRDIICATHGAAHAQAASLYMSA
jgi:transcription antitermination factor NusG